MREQISLTPEEVADILKITKNTVYELIKRGELPAYRVGRKLRVELGDVEAYKKKGKKFTFISEKTSAGPVLPLEVENAEPVATQRVVICGQDVVLDILANRLERSLNGDQVLRNQVGSFAGLSDLYRGEAQFVGIHLWDGDTGVYNIPYVRRLLPGIPTVIVHLAKRWQGFYVAKGNPKNIRGWEDLSRPDIRFVNREKGCGTRVLLDEHLRRLKLDRQLINGYNNEGLSHLAVASAVARGQADVGLGCEKASLQVRGLDFINLQQERYEMVFKQEDLYKSYCQKVLRIVQCDEFKLELAGLGDYDIAETGRIIAKL